MSAAALAYRHVDLDDLRERVSVAAVLRAAGIEAERERGRIQCPLHNGSNPTSFSYTEATYHCFAGCAGGDIYTLAQRLHRCDFPSALARVAQLAGLPTDSLPRLDGAEIERRQKLARRRAALHRWRNQRLTEWLTLIGNLDREVRLLSPHYMQRTRDGEDADGEGWRLLGSLHADLQVAENMVATLAPDDEDAWAETWLAEHRRQIPTPEELRL
jgi:hypothetical protein